MVKLELNTNWEFSQAALQEWLPATVPGTIHTDLFDNQIIGDPFYRTHERDQQWIDKVDWEYRTFFDVPADWLPYDVIELFFHGLDTYAYIFLNGHFLQKTDNMFRSWRVNLKRFIREGSNELLIYFRSPVKKGLANQAHYGIRLPAINDQSENGGLGPNKISVFSRKAGYHYGWDWGPRFVTSGLWRPVELRAWNHINLSDVFIRQEKISREEAALNAKLSLDAQEKTTVNLRVEDPETHALLAKNHLTLEEGTTEISLPFIIESPRLWWPNGLGEPALYKFRVTITTENGTTITRDIQTGLRQIRLVRNPDEFGESFYFEVNDIPVFAKGANYIPSDVFLPRVDSDQYHKVIASAAQANMNMIRVWGGGIYEDDRFYELCDELGIMVWQDFMFACSMYPGNEEFLENVRQEALDNVIRLRNHPSIVLWCGNNEIHTMWRPDDEKDPLGWKALYNEQQKEQINQAYRDIFHSILPEVVSKHDPETPYWPSSPQAGYDISQPATMDTLSSGDIHYWGVWHELHPFSRFQNYVGRFMSEYGFQSFPEIETVKKYTLPEDRDIESEVMSAHQRSGIGNLRIKEYMSWYYEVPEDFEQFLYMSQVLQAEAIQSAIQAHRSAMPKCMGSLYWQLNDCWPVASWASTDYFRKWKALHYKVRDVFSPVIVVPHTTNNQVVVDVVSDRTEPLDATLEVETFSFSGKRIHSETQNLSIPANQSSRQLIKRMGDLTGKKKPEKTATPFSLKEKGRLLHSELLYYKKPGAMDLPKNPKIRIKAVKEERKLRMTTDKLVKNLMIEMPEEDMVLSDNYFDLLPGKPREITWDGPAGPSNLTSAIKLRHVMSHNRP